MNIRPDVIKPLEMPNPIENQTKLNNSNDISTKVGKISYHFFKSHLAGLIFKTTLALSFAAIVLVGGLLSTSVSITIPIALALGIVTLLLINIIKNRKQLLFEISLLYTVKTGKDNWCTPITDNIVLGALPLAHHTKMLDDFKVTQVLTMVEDFERKPCLINPLTKDYLMEIGIDNLELPSPDFIGVCVENIEEGVDYIHRSINQNPNAVIYVHCKAGRGRSTTIVVAYLLKYGNNGQTFKKFEEAYLFIKEKRPQINLNKNQQATINEYWKKHCQIV
jgi:atypical dual specificity phosphatase